MGVPKRESISGAKHPRYAITITSVYALSQAIHVKWLLFSMASTLVPPYFFESVAIPWA